MEKKNTFYIDLNTRIITTIKVINTKLVNPSGFLSSEYVLYVFKVITPFNSWYIKKRYSDIKELFDFLVSHYPKLKFPVFPPKRFFSTKESTIIERKNGFEELFIFILNNIEIIKHVKLINFFKIKKTILSIYIENCILVNENKYTYDILDMVNSSSSSNSNDLSQNSDDSNKDKIKEKKEKNFQIKREPNAKSVPKADKDKTNKRDKEKENMPNKKNNLNIKENNMDNNIININENSTINRLNTMNNLNESIDKKNIKHIYSNNGNYFRRYEDFQLATKKYTYRSQVSLLIIKEFLRNLKIHSSHIFEIINDFTNYLKYKKKWKKFNENETKALFIGINKDQLIEDYYQYIFTEEKPSIKTNTGISDKTTLSSTPQSISVNNTINININSNVNNNINNINNIIEEDFNPKYNASLEGLLFNIGKFEENYIGARNCLQLLNKFFERQFNPEVDAYISIFKKLDIKFIKKMNICKFSCLNNNINKKLCFDIISIYISGYEQKKQIKILNELGASNALIDKILDYYYKVDMTFNSYNLE